jgi:hypothetical protein
MALESILKNIKEDVNGGNGYRHLLCHMPDYRRSADAIAFEASFPDQARNVTSFLGRTELAFPAPLLKVQKRLYSALS